MPNSPHSEQVSTTKPSQLILATAIPIFALLVAPLGVAGQNIGLGVATLCFIILMTMNGAKELKTAVKSQEIKQFILLWTIIVLPIVSATISRGASKDATRFFWGHIFVCFSVVMGVTLRKFSIHRESVMKCLVFVLTVLGIVSISQLLWGWKFENGHVAAQIKRAQGFYSHPLTLAYCALVPMPLFAAKLLATPRKIASLALGLSILSIIIASQSVTVLALTICAISFFSWKLLPRKQFTSLMIIASIGVGSAIIIPNPIMTRITKILSGQRGDHETPYPDDRMAFWHAHFEMFKDKPIKGHGTGLESEDRRPYYERIGLPNLKRPYEAHNMFLQYAVEGGFISCIGFVAFLVWWYQQIRRRLRGETWQFLGLLSIPLCFALGGLTQNAIQDSEVRYILMLTCAYSFWTMELKP